MFKKTRINIKFFLFQFIFFSLKLYGRKNQNERNNGQTDRYRNEKVIIDCIFFFKKLIKFVIFNLELAKILKMVFRIQTMIFLIKRRILSENQF